MAAALKSIDDVKKQFVNEIKLRGHDDKYLDRTEEREVLQIAIQNGVSIEQAKAALAQVCEETGYVLESAVVKDIRNQVETAAGNDGVIDQKEFDLIFGNVKRTVAGKKNDREIKKMIVAVMEETGNNKVRKGWFSNWYAALKTDLGIS